MDEIQSIRYLPSCTSVIQRAMQKLICYFLILLFVGCGDAFEEISKKDVLRPEVTTIVPEEGAVDVGLHSEIKIYFTEQLSTDTIIVDHFTVSKIPNNGPAVKINLALENGLIYSENELSITLYPATALETDSIYQVQILADTAQSVGLKDQSGNVLLANSGSYYTWRFTTSSYDYPLGIRSASPIPEQIVDSRTQIRINIDNSIMNTMDHQPENLTINRVNGLPVPGQVSYQSQTESYLFTPDSVTLPLNSELQAKLVINDRDDSALELVNFSWSFLVADGVLNKSNSVLISSDSLPIHCASRSVIDMFGNMTLIWSDGDSIGNVWARRFNNRSRQWESKTRLATNVPFYGACTYFTSIDSFGNVLVVWLVDQEIWWNRYDTASGTGWQNKISENEYAGNLSELTGGDGEYYNLVSNSVSDAFLIFSSGGTFTYRVARFDTADGKWDTNIASFNASGSPVYLDGLSGVITEFDPLGDAVFVWWQGFHIWALHYDHASRSGWENETAVGSHQFNGRQLSINSIGLFRPQVVSAPNGDFAVVWSEPDTIDTLTVRRVVAARYDNSKVGWDNIVKFRTNETSSGTISNVNLFVSTDPQANIVIGVGHINDIWLTRYDNEKATGWYNLLSAGLYDTRKLNVNEKGGDRPFFVTSSGQTTVAWTEFDGVDTTTSDISLWVQRCQTSSFICTGAAKIEDLGGRVFNDIAMTEDRQGNVSVLWVQDNSIFINRFDSVQNSWANPILSNQFSGFAIKTTDNPTGIYINPQLLVDDSGNFFGLVQETNGIQTYNAITRVWATRYDSVTEQWVQSAQTMNNEQFDINRNTLKVELDSSGKLNSHWVQANELWVNRVE